VYHSYAAGSLQDKGGWKWETLTGVAIDEGVGLDNGGGDDDEDNNDDDDELGRNDAIVYDNDKLMDDNTRWVSPESLAFIASNVNG
jgi:hypothetical protein